MEFPLVDIQEAKSTRERLLLAAVQLFARQGYSAVTIRDITDAVNLVQASFYTHFDSKEELFNEILDTIERTYMEYYGRLDVALKAASGFPDVLECLFAELKSVYHIFIYYGVSLVSTEQYRNEKASRTFHDVYMRTGIDYITKVFNDCVLKGWVKPFDTQALATFFMNNVFVGSMIRTQNHLQQNAVYDATIMFGSLHRFMLTCVEMGQ